METLLQLASVLGPVGILAILMVREMFNFLEKREAKKSGNGNSNNYPSFGCKFPNGGFENQIRSIYEDSLRSSGSWNRLSDTLDKVSDVLDRQTSTLQTLSAKVDSLTAPPVFRRNHS